MQLKPDQYTSISDYPWRHTYAAEWYAGSSETTNSMVGPNTNHVGRQWSPLVNSQGVTGPLSYVQTWDNPSTNYPNQNQQFNLTPSSSAAVNPVIQALDLTPLSGGPPQSSVTLDKNDNFSESFTFTSANFASGLRGLLFNYEFTKFAPGDELTISYSSETLGTVPGFEMQPLLMQPKQPPKEGSQHIEQKGTISMGDTTPTPYCITFTLTTASKNSIVKVSNLDEYGNG